MRVLYITTELPYPLTTGFLRHYHFLRALGRRHEITYLSLTQQNEVSEETIAALSPFVERMSIFGGPTEPALLRHVAGLPFAGRRLHRSLRPRFAARQLAREAHRLLAQERFDVVFFSGKRTYPAVKDVTGVPLVVDACDATTLRLGGEIRYAPRAQRLRLALRYLEFRRIERKVLRKTPHLAFASERDRVAMGCGPGVGEIVPQAVDLDYWTRRAHDPEPDCVIFTGGMNYPPNHDAALFLVQRILPLVRREIPGAKFYIVGRDPLPELLAAAAGDPLVVVTGKPDDMRTYFECATIACAPVRFASGMQFKVLEALAMEVPMVTMPAAADGLRIDGAAPPVLIGNDERELAAAVVSLLRDEGERRRLAGEGRRFVEEHFVWERSIEKLERMLLEASGHDEPIGEAAVAR